MPLDHQLPDTLARATKLHVTLFEDPVRKRRRRHVPMHSTGPAGLGRVDDRPKTRVEGGEFSNGQRFTRCVGEPAAQSLRRSSKAFARASTRAMEARGAAAAFARGPESMEVSESSDKPPGDSKS